MRKQFHWLSSSILGSAALFFSAACQPHAMPYKSKLDPLALQSMQTQEFETTKAILFASTVSVFQDTGFIIEAADMATGIITAKSPTSTIPVGFGSYGSSVTTRASAFVEAARAGYAKVRLNFVEARVEKISLYGSGPSEDIPNESPTYYEGVFNKIREAVFVRAAHAETPKPSPPAGASK